MEDRDVPEFGRGPGVIQRTTVLQTEVNHLLANRWIGVVVGTVSFVILALSMPPIENMLIDKDHGYQLALGRQIVLGEQLFVDVLTHYGPGIAYVSAATVAVSPGSPIVEMLVCALGYAVSIGLCASLVARRGGIILACVVAVMLVVALGRYYKWYYWLVPVVSLWSALGILETGSARWVVFRSGLVAGIAWLFRVDLGLASFVIVILGVGTGAVAQSDKWRSALVRGARGILWVFAGVAIPIGVWTILLFNIGGMNPVANQYRFYFDAANDLVSILALSPFAFDLSDPFGPASRTAIAQVFASITVLFSLTLGIAGLRGENNQARTTLLASGFLGASAAAMLPQAFHRADAPHLAQVLPILLLAWAFGFSAVREVRQLESESRPCAPLRLSSLASLVVIVLGIGWGILLVFLPLPKERRLVWDDPVGRISRVFDADLTQLDSSFAEMIVAANTLTGSDDRVLFLPRENLKYEAQVYYWVHRRMAGNLQAYYLGLFATPPWPRLNAELIAREPPAIVIAERRFILPGYHNETLEQHHPELFAYVRDRYTNTVFENDVWVLLAAEKPTSLESYPESKILKSN